jgi:hypothetical protein
LANEYGNTKRATDLTIDEFMLPLTTVVKSQFIAARSAARHMIEQRSGVILFLTGSPPAVTSKARPPSARRSARSSPSPRISRSR